ncbi:hypothetical protein DY000_02014405 [Brassica cretica]|uniref:Uncharacterized protein n=1 Tax=Brassica cretica TaxID=69181 RepID=A0ABQ7CUW9_BRACR|nr:hypothetical protein DY000_02014405 [Brassica cretica]
MIRKEARSLSTDNNSSVSLDTAQPLSTRTPVPSTDSRSPLSIDNTDLPSTDNLHPTSIDIPSRTSIDTEPRAMVAPLILVRDNNGDLHDQEGHLRNAPVVKEEEMQEGDLEVESLMSFGGSHWCRSTPTTEHRSTYTNQARSTGVPEYRSTTPTESTASCNVVKILTHEEFTAKHPHLPSPNNVRIDRHANNNVDRYSEANIDRQPSPPIDRRAPITYRVQMPKIDVARLNALRPKPKPSEQPPEPVRTPSDAGDVPMEENRVSTRRTLRRRKEKVAKHLKRGADEKEKENFQKRVFRIPLHKPFEEAYYSHRFHIRSPEESKIHESLQLATVEMSTIETHTATSIDSDNQKSTDIPHDESTDEYDEDFEEERAIEYRAILDEEDKLLHHFSWKRTAPSIDRTSLPSIDTQPQQRCRKGASTDTAYYKSIDTDVNRVRDGDYLIGSWADEPHHESFAVEIVTYTPGADKLLLGLKTVTTKLKSKSPKKKT